MDDKHTFMRLIKSYHHFKKLSAVIVASETRHESQLSFCINKSLSIRLRFIHENAIKWFFNFEPHFSIKRFFSFAFFKKAQFEFIQGLDGWNEFYGTCDNIALKRNWKLVCANVILFKISYQLILKNMNRKSMVWCNNW